MNLGKLAKKVLATVAPLAATALGGPFAPLALNVIKGVLGTDDESLIEQQLVDASPEILLKLKTAEKELKARMKELDIQEQDLYLKDTQDARGLAKITGIWPQFVLTMLAIMGFSTVLYVLVFKQMIRATTPHRYSSHA